MEVNVKEQQDKIRGEIAELTGQLQQINDQIAQLQQANNEQVLKIAKKQGALELLQSLSAEKPETKT